MSTARLTINLDALVTNWRNLNTKTNCETAAVVKANGYGLDSGRVATALAKAGARNFFVAIAEEGVALRRALGPGPGISVFSGHMEGDAKLLRDFQLTPMLNSLDQMLRHFEALPGHPFGVQLDSGMNRLGMEPGEWAAVRDIALGQNPVLLMSHLACADEPDHPMNPQQLKAFQEMTDGIEVPRSLSATGGMLLGRDYHFDLCRPGIGLYGGRPFGDALPVVQLDLPVIQIRDLMPGETVGYGNTWTAPRQCRIATVAAGYADGLLRRMTDGDIKAYAGATPCPVVGRISMDLITIDVTDLSEDPAVLTLLNEQQTVDTLADAAGTIGYEILTSLGARYARTYQG
ncbi:alanine racemase [Phaeobacter gallaeciensis]|uniref:Alanine racemase n=1 Tax=Phaeobacter gallaeciensis TaxID=60890 RepID=A0A1B0ZWL7_9RHOB|nr:MULTISPECIES: alanine racemase [Phaeobacter]MDF1770538.1 alanine racemase [Pseudophaeobacter sp. bin_em_oilr2.035]ANP38524.1 alanine racemase [Phaeobacter gallaeciensis]MDE4060139.1 alanine racemase [Phaeobacter gallaeciensis]MDE4123158.1 alanine racemase [Phaeobacter gallaeciensis]MDE4127726.1 alanine racemase [Phaeobacter gallaeciensis]